MTWPPQPESLRPAEKLAIGFCSGDNVNAYFVRALHNVVAEYPQVAQGIIHVISGPWMSENRNMLTKAFLENTDATKLIMLDTDIVFTKAQLIALASHDLDFVSGLYISADGRRMAATEKVEPEGYDWPQETDHFPEGLSKVLATGAGFQAVRREVFEKVGGGWFDPMGHLGEDVAFCERVREAGFDIWLDRDLQVGHMKLHAYMP